MDTNKPTNTKSLPKPQVIITPATNLQQTKNEVTDRRKSKDEAHESGNLSDEGKKKDSFFKKGGKFFSNKAKEVKESAGNLIKKIDEGIHKNDDDESDTHYELRIGFPGFSKKIWSSRKRSSSNSWGHPPETEVTSTLPESIKEIDQLKSAGAFDKIDAHASNATRENEQSVESLAEYLTKVWHKDIDKYRAIYKWITKNISYDADSLLNGTKTTTRSDEVLVSRKSVCEGYANLFYALAKSANLTCYKIGGWAAPARFKLQLNEDLAHAWNAIRVENQWHLVDSTWGAGYLSEQGSFVFQLDDFFFCPDPHHLIHTHYPEWSHWQLIPSPISEEEFRNLISVKPVFFKRGFELKSHKNAKIITPLGDVLHISLSAPPLIALMESLSIWNETTENWEKIDKSFSFYSRNNDLREFYVEFPRTGNYQYNIFSKVRKQLSESSATSEKETFEPTLTYHIEVTNNHNNNGKHYEKGKFPETFTRFQKSGHQLIEPSLSNAHLVVPNSTVFIKISAENAIKMGVQFSDKNIPLKELKRNGDFFEGEIHLGDHGSSVTLMASYPALKKGSYAGILQWNY